ncbi:MAG: NAD(P)H-hydrate dehydratase [Methanobacteriaceae archaeon]|jgi:NAD(P)H-hydrate epimerase|nr:NAD(P)H-hydrate dehydratase [Candidatus Methanorudis spinitermitis]
MDPIDMMVADMNCEDFGLSRLCLMENAGKCLSDEIAKISTFTFSKPVKIAIFTGSGGNGGDGFVAARHLLNRGFEVEVFLLSSPTGIRSEHSKINFNILSNMEPSMSRLKIIDLKDSTDIDNIEIAKSKSFSEYIIIDGILGTGIKGKLRAKVKKAVEVINQSNALKIAIDVPTGMDPLSGNVPDIAIKPEYTVTFHKTKSGVKIAGENEVGGLVICDIGIPIEAEIVVGSGDLIRLKNRKMTSHKGNNGKILIIGGSKDYHGAPAIAGMSALTTGVDLVYIATPKSASLAIKDHSTDLIVKEFDGDYLNLNDLDEILELAGRVDTVLIGPGSSQNEETRKLFNVLVKKIKKPLVLDADALKLIDLSLIKDKDDLIITPHLNEFKSFFTNIIQESDDQDLDLIFDNLSYEKLQEKITIFQKITRNINGTVILKGKYDFIFKGNKFRINKTGNPGMTVGGTGDSLAGVCASLLSQGLNSYDSGGIATYLNGASGDLAMEKYGYGFRASQLSEFLAILMKNI